MLNYIKNLSSLQKRLLIAGADLTFVPVALFFALALQISLGDPFAQFWATLPIVIALQVCVIGFAWVVGIPGPKLSAYESRELGKTGAFAVFLAALGYFLGNMFRVDLPINVAIVFGLIFFMSAAFFRLAAIQLLLVLYQRDSARCRVLIYGAGNTGLQIYHALKTHDAIVPVAFADDNTVLQGRNIGGLPVMKPSQIQSFAAKADVDRVLLAMPSLSLPKRSQIARQLEGVGLEVQALPSFAQLIGEETLVDKFAPVLPGQLLGRAQVDENFEPDAGHFAGKAVMVTGAGGSIGSELCRQILASRPKLLILYELSELALFTIDNELRELETEGQTEIIPVLGSVTDARLVKKVLRRSQVDVVLHAAAYKHVPLVEANALAGLANNVLGTSTLARESREAGVERFILISSDKAVRPANVMGASKRLAELVVQDSAERSRDTIFAMVRFGNVLGSSGSVIPTFQDQIARGGPVTLTHPEVNRFFMTVQEAVRLVLKAASFAKGGEVFVLDMGQPVPIASVARQMIEIAGYTVRDRKNPDGDIEIVVTGLRPGEKMNEELLIGEGFLTTSHEKIFAAREARLSEIEVAAMLRSLREAVAAADDAAALAVIGRWVEGWGDNTPKVVEAEAE